MPWRAITEDRDSLIDPEFLPTDFRLQEPTHLREEQLGQLLNFWQEREEAGEVLFEFKAYLNNGTVFKSTETIFPDSDAEDGWGDESDGNSSRQPKKSKARGKRARSTGRVKGKAKGKGKASARELSSSGEEFPEPVYDSDSIAESEESSRVGTPIQRRTTASSSKPAKGPKHGEILAGPSRSSTSRSGTPPPDPAPDFIPTSHRLPKGILKRALPDEDQGDEGVEAPLRMPSAEPVPDAAGKRKLDFCGLPPGAKVGPPRKKTKLATQSSLSKADNGTSNTSALDRRGSSVKPRPSRSVKQSTNRASKSPGTKAMVRTVPHYLTCKIISMQIRMETRSMSSPAKTPKKSASRSSTRSSKL